MAAERPVAAPVDAAQLLDSLSTAVVVVDDRARILHLNVAAEDLLAASLTTARGRRLADFVAAGDRLESLIVRARVGGEALVQREWELVADTFSSLVPAAERQNAARRPACD